MVKSKTRMNINWLKILANAGVSFFTTFLGIQIVIGGKFNPDVSIYASLFAAFMNACLSFCKELAQEADDHVVILKHPKVSRFFTHIVLF